MIFGRHPVGFLFESAQNEAEEKFGGGGGRGRGG